MAKKLSKQSTSKKPFKKIKLQSFRTLGRTTKWLKAHFVKIFLLTAIVAIPISLLRTQVTVDLSVVGSVAGLFLMIALIVVSLDDKNLQLKLSAIYNQASIHFLRIIGVLLLLTVLFVPAMMAVSVAILVIGQQIGPWPLLALLALIVAAFFVYFLVRLSLTGIAVVDQNVSVFQAARISLGLSKKRFWRLFGSLMLVIFTVLFASGLIIQLLLLVPIVQTNELLINLINGLLLSALLPIFTKYIVTIYQTIKSHD